MSFGIVDVMTIIPKKDSHNVSSLLYIVECVTYLDQ